MIEKIPFLHRQKLYNIITEDDLPFKALHYIIDELIAQSVFQMEEGCAELFNVTFEEVRYTIGVDGVDVMIVAC